MINLITNSLLGDNILHTFLQKAIQRKFIILDNTVHIFMWKIYIFNNIVFKIILLYINFFLKVKTFKILKALNTILMEQTYLFVLLSLSYSSMEILLKLTSYNNLMIILIFN